MKKERKSLIKLYANKYLEIEIGESLLNHLANITNGFASADIEATMRSIAYKLIAKKELSTTTYEKIINLINQNKVYSYFLLPLFI